MTHSKPQIVVVDDDSLMLESVKRSLRNFHCEVTVFAEPDKGLDYLRICTPQVLIVDHRMPRISGLELLQTLHREGRLHGLQVYICSAMELHARCQHDARQLGAELLLKQDLRHPDWFLQHFDKPPVDGRSCRPAAGSPV